MTFELNDRAAQGFRPSSFRPVLRLPTGMRSTVVPAYPPGLEKATPPVGAPQTIENTMSHPRKLEVIGQVTATVAHDFNNLLTAIMGNLTLLVDRLDDEQSRRLARRSLLAAERAAKVTKQLLALGHRKQLPIRSINIGRFVAAAAPRLRDVAGRSVNVELVASKTTGYARVEPIQLELALINLMTNARDAMPDGGRIVIETMSVRVVDGHEDVQPGNWTVICVTDTGCGMGQDVVAHAFEPFFTTKRVGAGTGLGLSMVRDVVSQLGGKVAIRSQLGAGTSVLIYLPQSTATANRSNRR
jgi:signal transduction histidine kinase